MNETDDILRENQRYYTLWKESNNIYEEWARAHGISANGLLVLQSLYDGVSTQKEICDKWCIPKQTINTILKDYETKGYLQFSEMEQDRRNKRIHLTSEGQAFVEGIVSKIREKETFVIQKMGLERLKSMNDNLELFNRLFLESNEPSHE